MAEPFRAGDPLSEAGEDSVRGWSMPPSAASPDRTVIETIRAGTTELRRDPAYNSSSGGGQKAGMPGVRLLR